MCDGKLYERRCSKCGKIFCPAPYHRYKDGRKMYCSWHCYNHRKDVDAARRRVYKRVEQYTKDGKLIRVYPSALNAAETIGGAAGGIRDACRQNRCIYGFLWKYEEGTEKS